MYTFHLCELIVSLTKQTEETSEGAAKFCSSTGILIPFHKKKSQIIVKRTMTIGKRVPEVGSEKDQSVKIFSR